MQLKTIDEFINESKEANIHILLNALNPKLDLMVQHYIAAFKEEHQKAPTPYDIECYRLEAHIDMIDAFGRYVKPMDTISVTNVQVGTNNSIVVNMVIIRDGEKHFMETEMIYAGGRNIQRLHYRYIVKTTLKKITGGIQATEEKEKLKKMTKNQKIQWDIIRTTNNYDKQIADIKEKMTFSRDQKLDKMQVVRYTWDTVPANAPSKKRTPNRAEWEKEREDYLQGLIDSFDRQYGHQKLEYLQKEKEKSLKKLHSKLVQ